LKRFLSIKILLSTALRLVPAFDRLPSSSSDKMNVLRNTAHNLDQEIGRSTFGRVFRLEGCGHVSRFPCKKTRLLLLPVKKTNAVQEKEIAGAKFTREVRAGLTTFFTMAYIIAVNVSPTESIQ
jgi:hypothetical protein